ncbi:MAG: efflux RND transporter periplasmic adaptor subunit [Tannerella sp.]|jgi:RND family efflux transporter MFP subunit|nr:efflux RND transporter periplasmic adaptor subunit [Tannerella sp.]
MRKFTEIIICVSAVLVAGCARQRQGDAAEALRTVRTDTVRAWGATPASVFPGKIRAAADVSLAFRIAGPVLKIVAEEGRFVRKGQTLAELDARDYRLQLDATEAEYKRIKAEADRVIELHGKGSVTPNDYDKAVYGLKQITAKLDAHRNALNDTQLKAPFDGYIQKRFFNGGETVGAGTPVLSMIDAGSPEVEINIPASEFIRRERFKAFNCTVEVFPDKVYTLDLLGITQKANMNQLYTVRLKFQKADAPLPSPGMMTMVNILYTTEETALVQIPYSALFEKDGRSAVWVYNADSETVTARIVKPSELLTEGVIVISEGLREGEVIVSAGVHVLKEGERVRLLPPVSSTNTGKLL